MGMGMAVIINSIKIYMITGIIFVPKSRVNYIILSEIPCTTVSIVTLHTITESDIVLQTLPLVGVVGRNIIRIIRSIIAIVVPAVISIIGIRSVVVFVLPVVSVPPVVVVGIIVVSGVVPRRIVPGTV